jgi:hypothetical protein
MMICPYIDSTKTKAALRKMLPGKLISVFENAIPRLLSGSFLASNTAAKEYFYD